DSRRRTLPAGRCLAQTTRSDRRQRGRRVRERGPVKRIVAVLAAAGIAVSGLVASSAGAATHGTGSINWGTCSDSTLRQAHAQCGFLQVPLDYGNPAGPTISLAVSRVPHSTPDSRYQGVMLVNPGGPGGSGLDLSTLGQFVPNNAGASYDWIGFDPRGVGSSKPALSCDPNYEGPDRPNYVPTTRALEQTWLQRSEGYARACGRSGGALLSHMTTIDSAKDMESIRAALGASQINYYGFSYGTYLGQV